MKELNKKFFEADARIETMFFLAGAMTCDALPQALRDFFNDEDWETLESCFGPIPDHVKRDTEAHDTDALPCWLFDNSKLGFVVQLATPVMRHVGSGASYSWGHYRTKWVYGDTLEQAIAAGFAWVASQREVEKTASGV